MSEERAIAFGVIGCTFLLALAFVGVRACGIADKMTFGRMEQRVDTENYYESQAYREGMRRDCDELMLAYTKAASPDEKSVVLATLRYRVAGAPPDAVPVDVRALLGVAR